MAFGGETQVSKQLLIAEDDAGFRETLALEFRDLGFHVTEVGSFKDFQSLEHFDFEYAVVDLKLAGDNGLKIVEGLANQAPDCRTIVLTGYGSIATAVRATKLGAINYLTKPASTSRILAAFDPQNSTQSLPDVASEPLSLARIEREYIENIVADCDGNISRAASLLGLHRQSLQRKLRKYPPLK